MTASGSLAVAAGASAVFADLLVAAVAFDVGTGAADYYVETHSNASKFKFGFDLEVDDTVIVVSR